jgi:CheY-like chemotaxis protein
MRLPPGRPARRQACCAVASDSQTEVALVHSLVEGEFSEVLNVATEPEWQALVLRDDVAVLLLAFSDLEAARAFQLRYQDERQGAAGIPAKVVMLCSRESVGAAYELCRRQNIFDYVLFWPVTHDPKRLPLALHRACDAYESAARAMPAPASAMVSAAATESSASAPEEDRTSPMPDLQVLVVEDHDFQLAVALSVLISCGLRATGASGAHAALAMLETATPDLILLDVDMPGIGGLELLRILKANLRFAHIPVIMLTVMREREMVLEAMRDGAADFIAKPFDRDTLLQKIRRVSEKVVY